MGHGGVEYCREDAAVELVGEAFEMGSGIECGGNGVVGVEGAAEVEGVGIEFGTDDALSVKLIAEVFAGGGFWRDVCGGHGFGFQCEARRRVKVWREGG
ncbi:hypothetical protein KS4_04280 [Poriferisphaera corsica]|uniref:Uncharacterized protein n=1 Tax=Poriferisphaera corsica TaxID=2528020 RepID=A0A517YQ97_9BACT|nr:hypothetical protein KS4_04280 [Poriferisphaera corsica]